MTKIAVCRKLKISRPTLEGLIKSGALEVVKFGGLPFLETSQLSKIEVDETRHNHKVKVR